MTGADVIITNNGCCTAIYNLVYDASSATTTAHFDCPATCGMVQGREGKGRGERREGKREGRGEEHMRVMILYRLHAPQLPHQLWNDPEHGSDSSWIPHHQLPHVYQIVHLQPHGLQHDAFHGLCWYAHPLSHFLFIMFTLLISFLLLQQPTETVSKIGLIVIPWHQSSGTVCCNTNYLLL